MPPARRQRVTTVSPLADENGCLGFLKFTPGLSSGVAPDRLDQLRPVRAPFRIATAHTHGRQRLGDLRRSRPDAAGDDRVKMGHVVVASDHMPESVERRVDNFAAAVIVHVGIPD